MRMVYADENAETNKYEFSGLRQTVRLEVAFDIGQPGGFLSSLNDAVSFV